jgi:dinuclear metal center YbgI/SA1388 family protein
MWRGREGKFEFERFIMITRTKLLNYLNQLLESEKISDYCPNGLQVEGRAEIHTLVTGVSACQALIERSIELQAEAVLVHHGFFWKNEDPCVVGIKKHRLATLLSQQINLFAYHLPLDIHLLYGNNVQLAKVLDVSVTDKIAVGNIPNILWMAEFAEPIDSEKFSEKITTSLQRAPLHIPASSSLIAKLAWCTGAAQDYLELAVAAGCDAFLTGEVSERTVTTAREYNIHFFAAGHHATERYGVKALGEHLAEKFDLKHHFVDIDNPV